MTILSILGVGGGTSPPPPDNSNDTTEPQPTDPTTETQDTAAPAAASESGDSATGSGNNQTDQQSQRGSITLLTASDGRTSAQAIVEAQLTRLVEPSESDARQMALDAQQRLRLEALIKAVATPTDVPEMMPGAAAEQAEVGNVETDGMVM
jgi:hypothetical protein